MGETLFTSPPIKKAYVTYFLHLNESDVFPYEQKAQYIAFGGRFLQRFFVRGKLNVNKIVDQ